MGFKNKKEWMKSAEVALAMSLPNIFEMVEHLCGQTLPLWRLKR